MIKLCGAVCIVTGTTCYGLFYAFQKKSRLWRLKQFKESLLCLSGQLRVARMSHAAGTGTNRAEKPL